MSFIYIQGFEDAKTAPGNLVNTEVEGTGGDGVYSIDAWGDAYSNRQVYISDFAYSGNRSIRHVVDRNTGEYTGCEAHINPTGLETPVDGMEVWARAMYYLSSDWDWGEYTRAGDREPKMYRVWWHPVRWQRSYLYICRRNDPSGNNCYGAVGFTWGTHGSTPNVNSTYHAINADPWYNGYNLYYKAPSTNEYELYKLPFGEWFSLETYIKYASDGIIRFWLNGTLVYEFRMNTINWPSSNYQHPPQGAPGLQTVSTWGGGTFPGDAGEFWVDDFIMTNDRSYVEANGTTDDFGNLNLGKYKSSGGGNNNGDSSPPVITNIKEQTTSTTATITWDTDEKSNSIVDYGPSEGRGDFVRGNEDTTKHIVEISDLTEDTNYYYRLSSKDASGNVTLLPEDGNRTFTTTKASNGGGNGSPPNGEDGGDIVVKCSSNNISLSVDGVGTPHVAFYDQEKKNYIYAYKHKSGKWIFEDIV